MSDSSSTFSRQDCRNIFPEKSFISKATIIPMNVPFFGCTFLLVLVLIESNLCSCPKKKKKNSFCLSPVDDVYVVDFGSCGYWEDRNRQY